MRAHYLQHVDFEGLGSIESWLLNAGYSISNTAFFQPHELRNPLPSPADIDLLLVLGGPMSANDEQAFSWLATEKRFIRDCIHAGIPVLGICLGAQLIAAALGARVYPNAQREIGWFALQAVCDNPTDLLQLPDAMQVFHWHAETFDLPPKAILLARSNACTNQAFQIGRSVVGLQFHLETTPQSAQALLDNCGNDLVNARYVQSAEAILAAPAERYRSINAAMEHVLRFLTGNAASPSHRPAGG
ncbi:MAG: amidotransferase [Spirochaetaceae bacterium]|nr:MAG: amidotransferase [Spirochaetaceae bacterium]